VAPGSADLDFKRGGRYILYYEYAGNIDGTELAAPGTPPADIELQMLDSQGEPLELERLAQEHTYDAGGFKAISLRRVNLEDRGLYHIVADAPVEAGTFAIAVGRGETPSTESTDRAALLVGIIGGAIGVIGLIATGVARSRSRARLAGWVPGAPGPGSAPPPPESGTVAAPPPTADDAGPGVPSAFSATAPLPLLDRPESTPAVASPPPPPPPLPATEPGGAAAPAPVPPPPPPPAAAREASPAPASSAGWAPPAPGSAADPFESHGTPPPPPPPSEP
jgi:hypothetical protein